MPYREDLEAALARTAAAEDELATARSENAHDHERIAELEKQLADARADVAVAETKSASPPPPSPSRPPRSGPPASDRRRAWWTPWILLPVAILLVVLTDEVIKHANKGKRIVTGPVRIDVMTELSRAKADARKLMPDAVLLQLETQSIGMVDARGFADLTKGFITFDFFSPSRRRYVHVLFMQGGARQVAELGSVGGLRVHDPPRCSVVDVWAEAIRRGASPSSLAAIHLGNAADGPAWTFEVGTFTMTLPDECSNAQ